VEVQSSITRLSFICSASYSYSVAHHALTITAEKWESIQKKALGWKGLVLEKYIKLWIGRRAQRATICIALAIHRYLVSTCFQAEKRKRKIENDIEKVNPQDLTGPLSEASCTSPKTQRSSFGVLHDTTICVWCRKRNYKTSDHDNRLLLLSTKYTTYTSTDLPKCCQYNLQQREEELSVICIKLVVKGKGRDQNTEMGSVHNEE